MRGGTGKEGTLGLRQAERGVDGKRIERIGFFSPFLLEAWHSKNIGRETSGKVVEGEKKKKE